MPLRPRISPIARGIIQEAFRDLEHTASKTDRADFCTTTLENVIKAAHKIEDELAARQLLRNMRRLAPLFTGLEYYSKSIEVICNGTPFLPWIWAPLKVILKAASDCINAFEKLIVVYARLAEPLARFKLLHGTHLDNLELQHALAIFYSDILKFHKEAYKFVKRSGWKVLFMTSWGRFQRRFDGIIDDLKAHEDLVDKTANAVGLCDTRKIKEELEELRRTGAEKAAKEEEERTAAQYVAIVGWLKMDACEQGKIVDSILAEPQKYSETCDWILRQNRIAAWMRCSQESSFLVLHGRPGTGKSVLMAKIAEFLRSGDKSLVISHLSTYTLPSSTQYDEILRSLLLQLVRHDTDLIAYIFDEFILKKKIVTSLALERLILEAVRAISSDPANVKYVHVLLDGLDECENTKQLKIVALLERISSCAFESTTTVVKVLVSCRMLAPTAQRLRQKHIVSLSDEKVLLGKSIGAYASQHLGRVQSRWSEMGISHSELKDLELRLVTKADGMFLWARLVLRYLTTNLFARKSEVMNAVDTLPRELSDFYGHIFTQLLANFDNRSVARLQSVLCWIAFAKRPLRRAEFRSALSFSSESTNVDIEELSPTYIFDFCAPLIEQRSDSTFSFVHISVKEFLQSPEGNNILDERKAGYEQGLAVVSCLLSGVRVFEPAYGEEARFRRVLKGFHGLHLYASEHWADYVLSHAADEGGIDTRSKFFARSQDLASAMSPTISPDDQVPDANLPDPRLCHIEQYPALWRAVAAVMCGRRLRVVQTSQEPNDVVLGKITTLSTLHINYQRTISALLRLPQFPGISMRDLEAFKREVRATALTCRVFSCPSAGIYFESEARRDEHELTHTPRMMCEEPGCEYPPFSSSAALQNHRYKQHNRANMAKIKIKKVPRPSSQMMDPAVPTREGAVGLQNVPPDPSGSRSPYLSSNHPNQASQDAEAPQQARTSFDQGQEGNFLPGCPGGEDPQELRRAQKELAALQSMIADELRRRLDLNGQREVLREQLLQLDRQNRDNFQAVCGGRRALAAVAGQPLLPFSDNLVQYQHAMQASDRVKAKDVQEPGSKPATSFETRKRPSTDI